MAPHVAAEFPGLGIATIEVDGRPGRSPEPVLHRLRDLSDRFYGAHAIHMRERPIPWAYRVFFRQIGLDPDRNRTPVEQLALDRLHDGAFKSHGMPADALTIATVETGDRAARLRRRAARGPALHPRLGAGGVAAGEAGRAAQGTLAIADEGEPRRACSSAPTAEGCDVELARPAASPSPRSRSRACPRSPSTRPSGWSPRRSKRASALTLAAN